MQAAQGRGRLGEQLVSSLPEWLCHLLPGAKHTHLLIHAHFRSPQLAAGREKAPPVALHGGRAAQLAGRGRGFSEPAGAASSVGSGFHSQTAQEGKSQAGWPQVPSLPPHRPWPGGIWKAGVSPLQPTACPPQPPSSGRVPKATSYKSHRTLTPAGFSPHPKGPPAGIPRRKVERWVGSHP